MHKATARGRHSHHKDYDLYGDLAKIKAALSDATTGAKDRAAEMLYQSIEDAKDRSAAVQENVGNYVAEKPIKSLGLAVIAGLLIGYFIKK